MINGGDFIKTLSAKLTKQGYKVQYKLLNAKNYGMAIDKKVVFIVGTRKDLSLDYKFPLPTYVDDSQSYITIGDVIGILDNDPGTSPVGKATVKKVNYVGFSLREIARLSSFSSDYILQNLEQGIYPGISRQRLSNSVPVPLAEAILNSIGEYLSLCDAY